MSGLQDTVFKVSEADAYFRRNRAAMATRDMSRDLPLFLIDLYQLRPGTVFEVGASNGFRLDEIRKRFGTCCVGLEPSAEAIQDAKDRFPEIQMLQGTAADIPWHDPFDVVIANYVLHWVDRSTLLQSVAEIDRMVKDGGYLILGDFAPANRIRVPYHHKEPLWTFKQDYGGLFVGTGLYHPVAYLSGTHGHGDLTADVPEHERAGCWLLEKRLTDHYVTTPRQEGV